MIRSTVLILNWNGWGDTIECLESVMRQKPYPPRVIVCDNGSPDNSLERIKSWADGALDVWLNPSHPLRKYSFPPVVKPLNWGEYSREEAEKGGNLTIDPQLVLIRTGANLGFAGGNNVGLRYLMARGDSDYIWLLNNDTVVASHSHEALIKRMHEKPDAGMCGSSLLYYGVPECVQALGGGYYCKWIGLPWHIGRFRSFKYTATPESAERYMNYVVGASLLVSRDFLEKIGLMCEDYFLYFEETDWAVRSKGLFAIAYAPDSIVYHKVGGSIGTASDPRKKSMLCDYFNIRNRIRFTRKFYPYALITIYPVLLMAVIVRLLTGQWQRAAMVITLMASGGEDGEFLAKKVWQ